MSHRIRCCLGLVALALLMSGRTAAAQPRVAEFVPDVLPLLPVTDGVLFPSVSNEIQIIAPQHKLLVEDAVKGDSLMGLVTLVPGAVPDALGNGAIFPIGVVCVIDDVKRSANGLLYIIVRAVMRFRVTSEDASRAYRMGHLDLRPETLTPEDAATLRGLRQRIDELARVVDNIVLPPKADDDRINALAFFMDLDLYERQSLLEKDGIIARARAMIELLTVKAAEKR
jgi:Lon protease-like protein